MFLGHCLTSDYVWQLHVNLDSLLFFRFSHAANAFELCDRKFKPVFAEPRRPNVRNDSLDRTSSSSNPFETVSKNISMLPPCDVPSEGYTRLQIIASPQLNQDQLWKLFDIVPSEYKTRVLLLTKYL